MSAGRPFGPAPAAPHVYSGRPARRPTASSAHSVVGERGQALVLGLLILAATVGGALIMIGLATVVALHAAAQSSADAAALACAADATLVRQVDARGVVYGTTAEVSPDGPAAASAAWRANAAAWPVRAVSFRAVPSGATCAVTVGVAAHVGGLPPLHGGEFTWTVTALARAYPPGG